MSTCIDMPTRYACVSTINSIRNTHASGAAIKRCIASGSNVIGTSRDVLDAMLATKTGAKAVSAVFALVVMCPSW